MSRRSKDEVIFSEVFIGSYALREALLNAREKVCNEGENYGSVGMSGVVRLVRNDQGLELKITEE